MIKQWNELKASITELRDSGGMGTQREVCEYLVNLMAVIEKQMQEPCDDCISRQQAIDEIRKCRFVVDAVGKIRGLPPAESEYEELTVEEAAREIVSGSTMSAWHLVDDMIRLEQMGYVICRKK